MTYRTNLNMLALRTTMMKELQTHSAPHTFAMLPRRLGALPQEAHGAAPRPTPAGRGGRKQDQALEPKVRHLDEVAEQGGGAATHNGLCDHTGNPPPRSGSGIAAPEVTEADPLSKRRCRLQTHVHDMHQAPGDWSSDMSQKLGKGQQQHRTDAKEQQ